MLPLSLTRLVVALEHAIMLLLRLQQLRFPDAATAIAATGVVAAVMSRLYRQHASRCC